MISGVVLPVCTIVRTTDKTAMAKISSTIAAPKISLASLVFIFPIDDKTWIDIAILVAVNAVAIKSVSSASNPYKENTKYPTKKGTMTPSAPIVNEHRPPRRNSLGVISNPATNNITIAANSPICLIVSSRITRGSH